MLVSDWHVNVDEVLQLPGLVHVKVVLLLKVNESLHCHSFKRNEVWDAVFAALNVEVLFD